MSLPYDLVRCPGVGYPSEEHQGVTDWREGCETCLRRTEPGNPADQWTMEPPAIIAFFCEYLIAPCDTVRLCAEPPLETCPGSEWFKACGQCARHAVAGADWEFSTVVQDALNPDAPCPDFVEREPRG